VDIPIDKSLSDEERFRIFSRWDALYKSLKTCNENLLAKSNREIDEENLIEDSFLFYISSFGLSFIKNLYLHLEDSLGNIINIRCMVEGLAILEYIDSEKHNMTKIALLRMQSFILERNIYKNYQSMNTLLFNFESIQKNYEEAKNKYKSILDLNSKAFSYLENSTIPFVDEHVSFETIIGKSHGEAVKRFYKLLSLLSHPHDFRSVLHFDNYINDFNDIAINLLEAKFSHFTPHQGGLETEFDNTLKFSPIPILLRKQNANIKNVCSVLNENGYHALSSFLYEISILQWDFYLDLALGFTEHATTKWKYFAELYALVLISITDDYYTRKNPLLYHHTQMQINLFAENGYDENDWEIAYSDYMEKFPQGVDIESFKVSYRKTLGFLIDKFGNVPSLKSIVYQMFDRLSPLIDNDSIFGSKYNIKLSDYLKMKYDESQIMSHANGYMFFAPAGSWVDGQNLMIYSDFILNELLILFLENEPAYRRTNSKTVRNVVRNYLKKSDSIISAKHLFFASPKINKNF
jgi:hypothetical protein